jgi:L-ascorbate metabolism protein UlaG (beta-lactamase superfamily)
MPVNVRRVGLSMFHISSPGGSHLLTDPWLVNNPLAASDFLEGPALAELDGVVVSHGHYDHSNGLTVAAKANPDIAIVAPFELANLIAAKKAGRVRPLNLGGTCRIGDVTVTLVPASHSSSYGPDALYAGPACGAVLTFERGFRIYYAGDTGMTTEMTLIRDYWKPDVAILPVGSWLTMDPEQAAYAAGVLLAVPHVIPCHYVPSPEQAPDPDGMRDLERVQPGFADMENRGAEFSTLMAERYPDISVSVLEIGDAVDLDPAGRR